MFVTMTEPSLPELWSIYVINVINFYIIYEVLLL